MKVIINGYSGTMGQVLTKCITDDEEMELVAGVSPKHHDVNNQFNTYSSFAEVKEEADVVIDFSNPLALDGILEYCLNTKTPVVFATTGSDKVEINSPKPKELATKPIDIHAVRNRIKPKSSVWTCSSLPQPTIGNSIKIGTTMKAKVESLPAKPAPITHTNITIIQKIDFFSSKLIVPNSLDLAMK